MSAIGFVLLMLALVFGRDVAESSWGAYFNLKGPDLALILIGYGFVASVLPVWLLLAPRDYLSTFMKIGVIALLAVAIIVIRPDLQFPAVNKFIDGSGMMISFPIEVRFVAPDDIPLSTAYGEQRGYIAVHRYVGEPFERRSSEINEIGRHQRQHARRQKAQHAGDERGDDSDVRHGA